MRRSPGRFPTFPRARFATALVSAIALLAVVSPVPAVAQTAAIQPGASIINQSGGECTLNWVYDGQGELAGEVYIGTAGHCVEHVGEQITLQSATFGDPLFAIGEVVLISPNLDYSLIRVSDENLDLVDPGMKGHPQIPSGMSTTETTNFGDTVQFSGNGVGFHATTLTQEERVGILHHHDETDWSALGPVSPGDSGGPAADVTDDNKALGIVTVLCIGTSCSGAGGVSLEGLLQDAASLGFTVSLRTT